MNNQEEIIKIEKKRKLKNNKKSAKKINK